MAPISIEASFPSRQTAEPESTQLLPTTTSRSKGPFTQVLLEGSLGFIAVEHKKDLFRVALPTQVLTHSIDHHLSHSGV